MIVTRTLSLQLHGTVMVIMLITCPIKSNEYYILITRICFVLHLTMCINDFTCYIDNNMLLFASNTNPTT